MADIVSATSAEGGFVEFKVGLSGTSTSTTDTSVTLALANGTTSNADLGQLQYQTANGWVNVGANGQAVIAAGQNSVQVRTLAVADSVFEGAETFTLSASANGTTKTGAGTITDTASGLADIASATSAEGGFVEFKVGLSGTSTSTTDTNVVLSITNETTSAADLGQLQYQAGNGDWVNVGVNGQAVITAGQNSVQVRTLAVVDSVYEGAETFTLSATANGTTKTGAGTVTDCPELVIPIVNGINGATITGSGGNDVIIANGGDNTIYGGGGNDMITAGGGVNFINGSNDTLLGHGEHDTLVGGGSGSRNIFILGTDLGSYYVGGGESDFATISGFQADGNDFIQLAGESIDYTTSFAGGVTSVFHVSLTGTDLVAKIDSTSLLGLNDGAFYYVNTNGVS